MMRATLLGEALKPVRGLAGRSAGSAAVQRPEGELLWCHATTQAHSEIALRLADRLSNLRPDIHLLLTAPDGVIPNDRKSVSAIYQPMPADTAAAAKAFLDLWRPDLCIWTAGDVRPGVLNQAHRREVQLFLVDAEESKLAQRGWRWLPNAARDVLRKFSVVMAHDGSTELFLRRRLGLRDVEIMVTGALRQESRPLPCNEADREELATLLRGRPIWHAAHLLSSELPIVLEANSHIVRMSHRTLLILTPERATEHQAFHDILRKADLNYITWSDGELPDENTEVILADTPDELGLWYRVSPISFMGSSLESKTFGSDPNEAAAHGSAILYGPNVRNHLETYSRFAEVGAARIVRDATTLSAAVQRILPPDQSAAMAHAAWDVATQSAAVMDRLVEMVMTALDKRKAL